jgi:acyl-CoA thioester hydrolase
MSARRSADFSHPVRIYWEDTDAGGVAFHANYLKYFERARTEWLRQRGIDQPSLRARDGTMFVVAESNVRYLRPARLDDLLDITVTVVEAGRASMTIEQVAWRGDDQLVVAQVRIGCVDAMTFKPRRMPTPLLPQVH